MTDTTTQITREQAQQMYEAAQAAQRAAIEAMTKAKEAQRAATVSLNDAKAVVMQADGNLLIAKAALTRLGGPLTNTTTERTGQAELRDAVLKVLTSATAPMTAEQIATAVQAAGVEMGGKNPAENLKAYLSRWKNAGIGVESKGRGLWGVAGTPAAAPEVPAFLAAPAAEQTPPEGTFAGGDKHGEVPSFLTPTAAGYVDAPTAATEDTSEPLLLPEGFPGREALVDAGFTKVEDLSGKTHDQLRRIKGIGAATAKEILATLEA